jgi:uncharacterized phage infection (PIP) family protein YhgE
VGRVRQLAATAVVSVGILAAAACGGGSPSPQESWANDVCSSVNDWKGEMQSIGDDVQAALKSPSADTLSTVGADANQANQATQKLVTDLKSTGPPPGDSGAQAKDVIDGLTKSLDTTLSNVKTQVEQLQQGGASLSEIGTALGAIGTQLSGAVAQAQSAFDTISSLTNEWKDAVDNADSCKELRKD